MVSVYSNPMTFVRSIPWRSYSIVVGNPSIPPVGIELGRADGEVEGYHPHKR